MPAYSAVEERPRLEASELHAGVERRSPGAKQEEVQIVYRHTEKPVMGGYQACVYQLPPDQRTFFS